jgi:hypothetical protein
LKTNAGAGQIKETCSGEAFYCDAFDFHILSVAKVARKRAQARSPRRCAAAQATEIRQ